MSAISMRGLGSRRRSCGRLNAGINQSISTSRTWQRRSKAWRERRNVERLLKDSPSLRRALDEIIEQDARDAVLGAIAELVERGEVDRRSPTALDGPGYSVEQLLDADWWPDATPD